VCGAADFEVISREMIEKIAEVEGGLQEETTYDGRKLRWTEEARKGLWTMKNAYQRRRTKARVEKRARMKKLDAITLEFAREVIEEETGVPLAGTSSPRSVPAETPDGARLIGRDERNNPLISTFDWTSDAAQRIFRVPAGFMRSQTQERIEELARDRAATAIDLGLVEEGIEIGKRMMAEMIANYPSQGKSPAAATPPRAPAGPPAETPGAGEPAAPAARQAVAAPAPVAPAGNAGGYLNEVSSLSATPRQA
jgi:hypothetical protein